MRWRPPNRYVIFFLAWATSVGWVEVSQAVDRTFLAEFQFNISQDTMSNSNTTAGQSHIYLGGVYLRMHPKKRLFLGAEGFSGTSLEKVDATTQAKATSQDVLLGIRYNFGKQDIFSIVALYGVASKLSFDLLSATAVEKWTGTSYMFRLGITPNLTGTCSALINLNYYSATYIKETSGDVVSRVVLFPTVGLSIEY